MSNSKPITYHRTATIGRLALQGVADIFEAGAIRAAAIEALDDERATTVRVDMAKLERMDLSTVQTLTALRRCVESSGRILEVINLRESEAAVWARIGVVL